MCFIYNITTLAINTKSISSMRPEKILNDISRSVENLAFLREGKTDINSQWKEKHHRILVETVLKLC